MNITKDKIKRFWEWCGFKDRGDDYYTGKWLFTNGLSSDNLPEITLDNIYKYAIPVLQQKGYIVELTALECNEYDCRIGYVIDGTWNIGKRRDNPIEALFNAIYEVIENENK